MVLCTIALIFLLARGEDFRHALGFVVVLLVASIPIAIEIVRFIAPWLVQHADALLLPLVKAALIWHDAHLAHHAYIFLPARHKTADASCRYPINAGTHVILPVLLD